MCGIVGYAGSQPATPILLQALHALEYRGYDSAGVAIYNAENGGAVTVVKRAGKLANLDDACEGNLTLDGSTGIGHTRWATHGAPTDHNAHPHQGFGGRVTIVHNGIVENYAALRAELQGRGRVFQSETDTETIAHLVEENMAAGASLLESLRAAGARLEGSQAIVAVSADEPGVIAGARIGNAGGLVVGHGDGEMYLASDLAALLPYTRTFTFLSDGQYAHVQADKLTVYEMTGGPIETEAVTVDLDPVAALKGEHPFFMLKEIHEQPQALRDTIASLVSVEPPAMTLDDLRGAKSSFANINRVVLIGMGTSMHSAMLGRTFIEQIAKVTAEVDNASEFRYRMPILDEMTLVVSVSQSGETVDVLEAMAVAKRAGAIQVTICNTPGAQTTRVADGTLYTRAGPERGVASTKCFTAQVVALYTLALGIAEARGVISADDLANRITDLVRLPDLVASQLADMSIYERAAEEFKDTAHMLFLGRGSGFPIAMEGALKMKEVSYIHAEGYAAGEMKHGPIALIDKTCPTVVIATRHGMRSKVISNMEQVESRGGRVLAIVSEGDEEIAKVAQVTISVPDCGPDMEPVLATIPLQAIAYYTAVARGCDVDHPRNLAKTVTVE